MPQTLPIEIHHLLEDKIGREGADQIASAIVVGFETIEQKARDVALQKKLELLDELRREMASKADIQALQIKMEGMIQSLRTEMQGETRVLRAEMQTLKTDLEGKIQIFKTDLEGKMDALTLRFNFMIVLLIIALTLMNPVAADLIRSYINK
jgi:hypothetical protein